MTQVVKYTTKVKGVRYTFWYIVLLTLCNGDRRIVQCLACGLFLELVQKDQQFNMMSFISLLRNGDSVISMLMHELIYQSISMSTPHLFLQPLVVRQKFVFVDQVVIPGPEFG